LSRDKLDPRISEQRHIPTSPTFGRPEITLTATTLQVPFPLHTAPPRVALRVLSSVIYILSPFFQSNLRHKREYFDDVTFNPSCRCHLLTGRHRDITPPNTPQSHQGRRRQLQRDARKSQDGSPRRRRIPVRNHDENVPPGMHTPAEPSACSLSQRRRRQLERENRPQPPQTPPPTNRSQAQAARRREAQSAQMDVDGTRLFLSNCVYANVLRARDYRSE
jgi:hypothetical protein